MALEALPDNNQTHRILIQDAPGDQHGVCIYVWQRPDSPIPERETRQVDLASAKDFCHEYYGVGPDDWREVPDEDLAKSRNMPLWYKTYRRKNPWTWFT